MPYKRDKNKVDKFTTEYIQRGFKGKEAMREISPELTDKALSNKTHRWLSSPEVIAEISQKIKKLDLTQDKVKDIIRTRLIKIIIEEQSKDSDAIQAGNVLAKLEDLLRESGNSIAIFNDRSKVEALIQKRNIEVSTNKDPIISNNDAIISNKTE